MPGKVIQSRDRRRRLLRYLLVAAWLSIAISWPLSTVWSICRWGPSTLVEISDGAFKAAWTDSSWNSLVPKPEWHFGTSLGSVSGDWGFTLPSYTSVTETQPTTTHRTLEIPLWLPLLVLSILMYIARRFWTPRSLGRRCPQCEYDLRLNTSGICPECGSTIHEEPAQGVEL